MQNRKLRKKLFILKKNLQNIFPQYQIKNKGLQILEILIDDLNHLPEINDQLKSLGYFFQGEESIGKFSYTYFDTFFPHQLFVFLKREKGQYSIIKPDFNNSIINITANILTHFGGQSEFSPLPDFDLGEVKHIFLIVLDGMGTNILTKHLPKNSFLRKYYLRNLTSVFPPTTVAATTVLISGKLPGETGWIGWQQYFPEIKQNIELYAQIDYYTQEPMKENVIPKFIPLSEKLTNIKTFSLYPNFMEDGFDNFADLGDKIIQISNFDYPTYTYAYWNEPDKTLHHYGCNHYKVKKELLKIDKIIRLISQKLGEKSVLIITADHGMVDIKTINLKFFPEVTKYLTTKPAFEHRFTSFTVSNHQKFKAAFNKYFQSYFYLYSKSEFIASNLLGKINEKTKALIGDFIAISKSEYAFNLKDTGRVFKSNHAGITSSEMLVPLIVFRN